MRQKFRNEAKCEFHTKSSRAASLHEPRFAYLQSAWSLDSQVCRGRPTRRVPKGCHDNKRWTHRFGPRVWFGFFSWRIEMVLVPWMFSKLLGFMINTHTDGSHGLDLEHHLQAASRVFCSIKSILCGNSVSIAQQLAYSDAMVTPVVCLASGHRKIYKQDLRKLDIKFRKVVRTVVGPPGGLDWSVPWHDILDEWNKRVPGDAWNNIGN